MTSAGLGAPFPLVSGTRSLDSSAFAKLACCRTLPFTPCLCHLTTILWASYYSYLHFTQEETEAQRVSKLPKLTELVSGRPWTPIYTCTMPKTVALVAPLTVFSVHPSLSDRSGSKAGWEWYHPMTLHPRRARASEACVCETGSISHWRPVLRLLHGSAAHTWKGLNLMITLKSCFSYYFNVSVLSYIDTETF